MIFSYEGNDIRLVSQQRVDLAVTGFDSPPEVRSGHFADVRAADGRSLTRVPIHAAFPDSVEVFPEDHGEAITRVPAQSRSGAFTVVVPARPEARTVTVIRVEARTTQAHLDALDGPTGPIELGTFQLDG